MADAKFDFEAMKSVMSSISTDFTTLATAFDTINDAVTTKLNVTADSSVYGDVGDDLLDVWSANASTFGDFKKNFETWSETMTIIHNRNQSFSDEAVASFASNTSSGLSLDGVADARNVAALAAGYAYAGYDNDGAEDGSFDDKVYFADTSIANIHSYEAENGYTYTYKTDSAGNMLWIETKNASDVVIDYKTFDPINGGVSSQKEYNGNIIIEHFYDADGNVASTAHYVVDENGDIGNPQKITYVEDGKTYTAIVDGSGTYTIYEGTESVAPAFITTGVALAVLNDKFEVQRGVEEKTSQYGITYIDKLGITETYSGTYDGQNIIIPNLTSSDFESLAAGHQELLMNSNATVIRDSAMAVSDNLNSEVTSLQTIINNLPSGPYTVEQQAVIDRVNASITSRSALSSSIATECEQGGWVIDGAIGNVATGFAVGSGGYIEGYDKAAVTATNWNASLSELDDYDELIAALKACGLEGTLG